MYSPKGRSVYRREKFLKLLNIICLEDLQYQTRSEEPSKFFENAIRKYEFSYLIVLYNKTSFHLPGNNSVENYSKYGIFLNLVNCAMRMYRNVLYNFFYPNTPPHDPAISKVFKS